MKRLKILPALLFCGGLGAFLTTGFSRVTGVGSMGLSSVAWAIAVSLVFLLKDAAADVVRRKRMGWRIHPLVRRRHPVYWAAFPVCAAAGFLPSPALRGFCFCLAICLYLGGFRLMRRRYLAEAKRAVSKLKCSVHGKRPSLEMQRKSSSFEISGCCEQSVQAGKVAVEEAYNR